MSLFDNMSTEQELAYLRQWMDKMGWTKEASATSTDGLGSIPEEAYERLHEKIDEGHWTGGTNSDGYPKVKILGKSELASHVLLKEQGRTLHAGEVVMHKDNDPKNLRLRNLRVGTQADNLKQMRDEGRDRPRGVDQEPDMKTAARRVDKLLRQGGPLADALLADPRLPKSALLSPSTPRSLLDLHMGSHNPNLARTLPGDLAEASTHTTAPERLRELAFHSDPGVVRAVAANPAVPDDVGQRLWAALPEEGRGNSAKMLGDLVNPPTPESRKQSRKQIVDRWNYPILEESPPASQKSRDTANVMFAARVNERELDPMWARSMSPDRHGNLVDDGYTAQYVGSPHLREWRKKRYGERGPYGASFEDFEKKHQLGLLQGQGAIIGPGPGYQRIEDLAQTKTADALDDQAFQSIKRRFELSPGVTQYQTKALAKRMGMDPTAAYQVANMDASHYSIPVENRIHALATQHKIPYPRHLGSGGRQPKQLLNDDILEGLSKPPPAPVAAPTPAPGAPAVPRPRAGFTSPIQPSFASAGAIAPRPVATPALSAVPRPRMLSSVAGMAKKLAAPAAVREMRKALSSGQHSVAEQIAQRMGQSGLPPRFVKGLSSGGAEAAVDLMAGAPRGGPAGLFARKLYKPDSFVSRGIDTTSLLAEKKLTTDMARAVSPEAKAMVPAFHSFEELHPGTSTLRHTSDHEFVPGLQPVPKANRGTVTEQLHSQVVKPLDHQGFGVDDIPRVAPGGSVVGNVSNLMQDASGQPKLVDFTPQGPRTPVQMVDGAVRSPYLNHSSSFTHQPTDVLRREVYRPTRTYPRQTLPSQSRVSSSVNTAPPDSLTPRLGPSGTTPRIVAAAQADNVATKVGALKTELLPHQQRVVDRMRDPEQTGLVVVHGLGSGKCVRGDTLIYTDRGLLPIRELFSETLPPEGEVTLAPGATRVVSLKDGDLVWSSLRARYVQKLPDSEHTFELVTQRGNRVEVTGRHPLLVLREGVPTWVSAADVKEGDWAVLPSRLPESPTPLSLDTDLVDYLAWQVTEGWEDARKPGSGTITQDDPALLQELQNAMARRGVKASLRLSAGKAASIAFCNKGHALQLQELGYAWGKKSKDKALPSCFLSLEAEQSKRLLGTLWSAEGSVSTGCAEMTLASRRLLDQVKYLLLLQGGRSTLQDKWACATNGTKIKRQYWRMHVSGSDVLALGRCTGLFDCKREALQRLEDKPKNPNTGIPCAWLFQALRDIGVVPKMLRMTPNSQRSISHGTAKRVCERLRWLGSDLGRAEVASKVARLRGTALGFLLRLQGVMEHPTLLNQMADRLEWLTKAPVRFEQIVLVRAGEQGGYVFDIEVDSDVYADKNYVGGSGGWFLHNTLTSIATQDALKSPATVVVPAALQENYRKEQTKHLKGKPQPTSLETLQRVALEGSPKDNPLLVVDEAHRARDHASSTFQALKSSKADKRLLLTGSPFYNHPSDIAPLVNLAANKKLLPMGKEDFESKYVGIERVSPGFIAQHLMGVQPGERPVLNKRHADELREVFKKYVDYHPGSTENFPQVSREDVVVPMSSGQKAVYDTLMGEAPSWVAAKVRRGLPPNKQEAAQMNGFLTGPRQAANTSAPYVSASESAESPKLQEAFKRLQKTLTDNPNGKAVVYSNFLDAGINPYRKMLEDAKIPHGVFTGQQKPHERDQMVREYNEGKLRALLLSSAGGEGLDLKGTRLVQLLDPHWNAEKLKQVEGRAARFKSHEGLAPEEQKVLIERYLSGVPQGVASKIMQKVFGRKPDQSVDQYLAQMSQDKDNLNQQFKALLPTHTKTASRWRQAIESGEVGPEDVQRLVQGRTVSRWLPSARNLVDSLREPAPLPPAPTGDPGSRLRALADASTPSDTLAKFIPKPYALTARFRTGFLSPVEDMAIRHPNAPAPTRELIREHPRLVADNPFFPLNALMDPRLQEYMEEATSAKKLLPKVRESLAPSEEFPLAAQGKARRRSLLAYRKTERLFQEAQERRALEYAQGLKLEGAAPESAMSAEEVVAGMKAMKARRAQQPAPAAPLPEPPAALPPPVAESPVPPATPAPAVATAPTSPSRLPYYLAGAAAVAAPVATYRALRDDSEKTAATRWQRAISKGELGLPEFKRLSESAEDMSIRNLDSLFDVETPLKHSPEALAKGLGPKQLAKYRADIRPEAEAPLASKSPEVRRRNVKNQKLIRTTQEVLSRPPIDLSALTPSPTVPTPMAAPSTPAPSKLPYYLAGAAAAAVPAAVYYDHVQEKRAEYEEPSETRTKALRALRTYVPLAAAAASGGAMVRSVPGTAAAAGTALTLPIGYLSGKIDESRSTEKQMMMQAKRVVKNPRYRAEVEDQAELSGPGFALDALKNTGKHLAVGGIVGGTVGLQLGQGPGLSQKLLPVALAGLLGGSAVGGVADSLQERDRARQILNRYDKARSTTEVDDQKTLHRLKKRVRQLESKYDDTLLAPTG